MQNDSFKEYSHPKIDQFWRKTLESAQTEPMTNRDFKLPLARIKRLMKVEEEVKMVANEVPVIFSKVTEKFVEELTTRAWIYTEESRRRILQKNDISAASKTSDVFDFLIYVVPRNENVSQMHNYLEKNDDRN